MEQHVQFYLQSAVSKNTLSSYSSAHRRYTNFCQRSAACAYPTSEHTLCQFASFLGHQHLKYQTIKSYLSGVRYFHIMLSHADPFIHDMPRLHYVLRGIKCEEAKNGSSKQQRLPITPNILLQVHTVLIRDPKNFDNIMLWAASLLCFFGFLRSGEITIPAATAYDPTVHLNFADIAVNNPSDPSIIQVKIKASKTDPFRQGVLIHIGKTGCRLCPVQALLNYLTIRGKSPGPLFHSQDRSPLTKAAFTSRFRAILHQAGIDGSAYAGHSFRIGAASTAAANGVEDSLIQTLGRWKSSAYLTYIRVPPENLAAVSKLICKSR